MLGEGRFPVAVRPPGHLAGWLPTCAVQSPSSPPEKKTPQPIDRGSSKQFAGTSPRPAAAQGQTNAGVVHQRETPVPRPPEGRDSKRPAPRASLALAQTVLPLSCPTCSAPGAIRWAKLGHVHVCRRCSQSFRVDPQGGLVAVMRTRENRWVEQAPHRTGSTRDRSRRFVARRLLPLLAVAAVILLTVRVWSRQVASSGAALPREAEAAGGAVHAGLAEKRLVSNAPAGSARRGSRLVPMVRSFSDSGGALAVRTGVAGCFRPGDRSVGAGAQGYRAGPGWGPAWASGPGTARHFSSAGRNVTEAGFSAYRLGQARRGKGVRKESSDLLHDPCRLVRQGSCNRSLAPALARPVR